jgi:threonine dehydrogenase-like Zn-dependent dehydrogenase
VLACGICGSDLHMALYGEQMAQRQGNRPEGGMDLERGVVMGHEFVAQVEEVGEGVSNVQPGQRVTSMPVLAGTEGIIGSIGYNSDSPGGYGEYIIMSAALCLPVPDHVSDTVAATTEPCAVGLHAVNAIPIEPDEKVLIMGAGPIGLMCLLWLKQKGIRHVTVSDPAAPRRELAQRLGADRVVDPRNETVVENMDDRMRTEPQIVFEAVGVEGTIKQAMELAGRNGRIVVAGACMTDDQFTPMVGIGKQLTIKFVLGYTPDEFAETLQALSDGSIDTSPLVTREVSLDELPGTFQALASPEECKVVVRP